MLYIDSNTMLIAATRGDSVSIVFSAKDSEDNDYDPVAGDKLTFAVAKKVGADPIFSITNEYDGVDEDAFWTIEIEPEHTESMKFADYVWDIQLETSSGVQTIIGKTDELSPKFRVWGEVAQEVSQEV